MNNAERRALENNMAAVDIATDSVYEFIKSAHVIMVAWCQCCAAKVDVSHICECEQEAIERHEQN